MKFIPSLFLPVVTVTFPLGLAAAPTVRRAEVATEESNATPHSGKEMKILRMMGSMETPQLEELLEGYARLNNRRMAEPLIREILRRDPRNTRAMELYRSLSAAAQFPDDPEALSATNLILMGRHAEAVKVLTKLKTERYRDRPFRYQQDLAYALFEAGRMDEARKAFKVIINTTAESAESRADAKKTVRMMLIDSLMRQGEGQLAGRNAGMALKTAEALLQQQPGDPDAVALKAAALGMLGRPREAVNYLMVLKVDFEDFFPHQLALGDAFYESKMFEDAIVSYGVVLADKRFPAEQKRDAAARLQELERDRRITAAEHAMRTKDRAALNRLLAELKPWAAHPDVMALRAGILTQQRRYREARELLVAVRDKKYPGGSFFPSRPELAEAMANTGAWGPAAAEYRKVEVEPRYGIQAQYEAARAGREMLARVRPAVVNRMEYSRGAEGSLWSSEMEASTGPINGGRSVVFLRGLWEEIGLGAQRLITQKDEDRYQIEAAWRRIVDGGFFGEVAAGGGSQGVTYGASVGRYEMPGAGWELKFRANESANDSLHLLAMGGTQDRVSFNVHRRLSDRWYLDGTVGWRRVEVERNTLGSGIDIDFNLGYTLLEERSKSPELAVNYFAEMQYFRRHRLDTSFLNRRFPVQRREDGEDPGASLIDERINRHGLILTASKLINPRLSVYVYGGGAYEFENRQAEIRAGAGLEAFINKNATFTLGLDYSSSGNAGNRADDILTATALMRVSF